MSSLAVCFLVGTLLAFSDSSGNTTGHHQGKRSIIYPNNSVIQFSLGLALPADVRGRNIATNSGILININLPTNISELRPPQRSIRSTSEHAGLLRRVTDIMGLREDNKDECIARSLCMLHENRHLQSLVYDIVEAVVDLLPSIRDGIIVLNTGFVSVTGNQRTIYTSTILLEGDEADFFKRRKRNNQFSKEECFKFKEKCNLELFNYLDDMFQKI